MYFGMFVKIPWKSCKLLNKFLRVLCKFTEEERSENIIIILK